MGRLILLGLAVLILVWLVRRALGPRQGDASKVPGAPGELVACAHCGVLLPRSEARNAAGAQYCSEEHARLGPRRP
ncbi:MAG: PP0621 family protein [Burkholderiales bacterium]